MELISLILLTFVGVLLVLAEIIFIPGTTIAGILGGIMIAVGIYLCYENLGSYYGHLNVAISSVSSVVLLYLSFKFKWWNLMAMNKQSEGKLDYTQGVTLEVGEEGKTTSALRPMGQAEFQHKIFEVVTEGGFLPSNTPVRIIKIDKNKILVAPINN